MAALALLAGLGWVALVAARPDRGMAMLSKIPGARVDMAADAAVGATFDEVRAWPESAWVPRTGEGYLMSKHGTALWVRVTLPNAEAAAVRGILSDTSYFSDRLELWAEGPHGWSRAVSGGAVRGEDKPVWGRLAAFPLELPAGGARTVYLRASDGYLPHVQPVWWASPEEFHAAKTKHALVQCVCFGALLALVFYNAVLWLRLRFEDTGYYVLTTVAGMTCNFTANGGFALVGVPLASPWLEVLVAASMAAGAACMTKFSRVFLGTREKLPRADRWLRGWQLGTAALAVLTVVMIRMPTPHGVNVGALAAVFTDLFCMGTAAVAWRRGVRHARFFLAAFGFLALAGVPMLASAVRSDVGAGVAMALLIGRTLEMLLLSFAVADRFAETQRRLVDETEQRRAVEAAYADELEVEVRERTRELAEANADKDRMIAVIGHDLRSPLTAVTRTAEQLASGGEAAPGAQSRFIKESAQVGRQVLLLIEDLVLWARLRAGTTHAVARPVGAVIGPVIELHRPLAEGRGVDLGAEVAPECPCVETDLVLAQTLVRNLVANGLRYARTNVRVEATPSAEGVRVSVHDDGPGLPPAVAARLKSDAVAPDWAGHGLGLRLCAEIGRALGAGLRAEPGTSGGTVFSFTLPVARTKAGESSA